MSPEQMPLMLFQVHLGPCGQMVTSGWGDTCPGDTS